MTMKGHVVVTFNVHKDGRITDLQVMKPSSVDAFTNSAHGAIASSNPTVPLPPEYPDSKAFFTANWGKWWKDTDNTAIETAKKAGNAVKLPTEFFKLG